MLLPDSHAWTPFQKWLILSAAFAALALCGVGIYRCERYYRGPTEAIFFGTWEIRDPIFPDTSLYYEFKPDHTYHLFSLSPQQPNDRSNVETGRWYAGGEFIYVRIPYENASYTGLTPWHIDSTSSTEVQVHAGRGHVVFRRVSLHSPPASNKSLEATAGLFVEPL